MRLAAVVSEAVQGLASASSSSPGGRGASAGLQRTVSLPPAPGGQWGGVGRLRTISSGLI